MPHLDVLKLGVEQHRADDGRCDTLLISAKSQFLNSFLPDARRRFMQKNRLHASDDEVGVAEDGFKQIVAPTSSSYNNIRSFREAGISNKNSF